MHHPAGNTDLSSHRVTRVGCQDKCGMYRWADQWCRRLYEENHRVGKCAMSAIVKGTSHKFGGFNLAVSHPTSPQFSMTKRETQTMRETSSTKTNKYCAPPNYEHPSHRCLCERDRRGNQHDFGWMEKEGGSFCP